MSAIGKDAGRRMIVIDPCRTEVADLADLHLALRSGTDAFLMGALLAMIVARGGQDDAFLAERTTGWDEVRAEREKVPVDAWLAAADISREQAEMAVTMIIDAASMTVRADVGVQQSRNSTLNAYLEKLLFLVTGNFLNLVAMASIHSAGADVGSLAARLGRSCHRAGADRRASPRPMICPRRS